MCVRACDQRVRRDAFKRHHTGARSVGEGTVCMVVVMVRETEADRQTDRETGTQTHRVEVSQSVSQLVSK